MARQVVLVHAPLVGASTWKWVADELRAQGEDVVVPRLRVDSRSGNPFDQLIEDIVSEVSADEAVLVGHSGGGVLLPFVAVACSAKEVRLVFVDAGLPPVSGPIELAEPEFRASLDARADSEGLLPQWHAWWGDDGMRWMVPDERRRATATADIEQLPLTYYDSVAVVPCGWPAMPAGYVLLSETYRVWAQQAQEWSWPVVEVRGTHLELVNRPAEVAAAAAPSLACADSGSAPEQWAARRPVGDTVAHRDLG